MNPTAQPVNASDKAPLPPPGRGAVPTGSGLATQIEQSRTRMLIGHIPRASLTVGVFALIIVVLVYAETRLPIDVPTLLWLLTAVVLSLLRTSHAITYLRSDQRQAPHWRPAFMTLTGLFGLCWAALPWVLPLRGHAALESSIIGAMIGMAATGAAMLGFDRIHTRIWISPMLGSATLYCIKIGGPLGWFGVISVLGFFVILWLESDRAHRRIGEMLRLRFESEELAQARAQALQEAESLSAAKSRFLATMSHEMRTPLHGILGLSRMLRDDLHSSTAQARMSLLQNAGEHLLGVINDVLDFSRLRENKLKLKPRPVDLLALASEVCELADVTARDKGVTVTLHASLQDVQTVKADPDRLRQILTNLVGNAVKFTHNGRVLMRLKQEACTEHGHARIRFEVEDTGVGIPPQQLDKVFDAFHQIDTRDERSSGGTGLGLSIAQQLCMAMHGQIQCESQPGIGSTFWFTLTMRRAALPAVSDVKADQPAHSRDGTALAADAPLQGCILIVEDNPVNALVAQAMLEQTGLQVDIVENGRQALTWLMHRDADLVLMDCHMPEMGGLEATRHIRERELRQGRKAVPIVAVSAGKYHGDDHRQCLAAGMNDYLSKPFHRDELVRVLNRHLGHRPDHGPHRLPARSDLQTPASASPEPEPEPNPALNSTDVPL